METWPPFSLEDIMETKQEVLAWAKAHDIEIIYRDQTFYKYVVAFAPKGQWFANYKMHDLSLWEERDKPDWRAIGIDLMDNSDLAPCPLEVCAVCHD